MSSTQIGQEFSAKITDAVIVKYVSNALRREHANINSAIKQIARLTGINTLTVGNWYKGKCAPTARHLLVLAMYYPQVLRAMCELMEMDFIWQHAVESRRVENMSNALDARRNGQRRVATIEDKFVLIRVRVDARNAVQLNQRQLWFLGQLQHGEGIVAGGIMQTWQVHAKTARRDIKGLIEAKLIIAIKSGRNHRYELL